MLYSNDFFDNFLILNYVVFFISYDSMYITHMSIFSALEKTKAKALTYFIEYGEECKVVCKEMSWQNMWNYSPNIRTPRWDVDVVTQRDAFLLMLEKFIVCMAEMFLKTLAFRSLQISKETSIRIAVVSFFRILTRLMTSYHHSLNEVKCCHRPTSKSWQTRQSLTYAKF